MAIKPILFNTEMVRAIMDGRKTCTRRTLKHPFIVHPNGYITKPRGNENLCPYDPPYQPGDILYVRESVFQGVGRYLDVSGETVCVLTNDFEYYADGLHEKDHWKDKHEHTWMHRRPSIHMPKEAARIWLKVTDVRVERLQEITIDGIRSEGLSSMAVHAGDMEIALKEWELLWNSTIKKSDLDRYGWNANPYVWVIEFERCEKPKGV